jgi:hypothetical protein
MECHSNHNPINFSLAALAPSYLCHHKPQCQLLPVLLLAVSVDFVVDAVEFAVEFVVEFVVDVVDLVGFSSGFLEGLSAVGGFEGPIRLYKFIKGHYRLSRSIRSTLCRLFHD